MRIIKLLLTDSEGTLLDSCELTALTCERYVNLSISSSPDPRAETVLDLGLEQSERTPSERRHGDVQEAKPSDHFHGRGGGKVNTDDIKLYDLPNSCLEFGSVIHNAVRKAGFIDSATVVISEREAWSLTVGEFLEQLKKETAVAK